MYIKSDRCKDVINTRFLDFESSKSDHRRRTNRGLKFGQIWYFPKRSQYYFLSIFGCRSKHFPWQNGSTWHYRGFPEVSPQSDTGIQKKALYKALDSNRKNSFRGQATPKSLKLMLKIHICQYEDPPEISSPPDEESCETAIRLLTGALICAVKLDIMFVLEFYSTCAIFNLRQSTCYIETERSL